MKIKSKKVKSNIQVKEMQYYPETPVTCSCGAKFSVGSTKKEIQVEICSNCHPFYTGNQKLIDTSGRVDKFKNRIAKQQEMLAKLNKNKKIEPDKQKEGVK